MVNDFFPFGSVPLLSGAGLPVTALPSSMDELSGNGSSAPCRAIVGFSVAGFSPVRIARSSRFCSLVGAVLSGVSFSSSSPTCAVTVGSACSGSVASFSLSGSSALSLGSSSSAGAVRAASSFSAFSFCIEARTSAVSTPENLNRSITLASLESSSARTSTSNTPSLSSFSLSTV